MFVLQSLLTTFVAWNLVAVNVVASPLFRRDVIAPRITSPTADSVWPVGSVQTVTWDTSDIPPPSQITNPIGQIILGFNSSDSLNLDFDHPLAQGFNLTDGSVQVTVPNVTPRDDYLIVLFGDSGDTSPQFAITKISAPGSSSSSPGSSPAAAAPSTASLPVPSLSPITGSATTEGSSATTDDTSASTTASDVPLPTVTSPSSSSSISASSSSSSSSSFSASAAAAQTTITTSAAWSLHPGGPFDALALCMTCLVALIMV